MRLKPLTSAIMMAESLRRRRGVSPASAGEPLGNGFSSGIAAPESYRGLRGTTTGPQVTSPLFKGGRLTPPLRQPEYRRARRRRCRRHNPPLRRKDTSAPPPDVAANVDR